MMVVYSVILILSTLFASWAMGRVLAYVLKELGLQAVYAQLGTLFAALGFLLVVSMPAGVMVGAVILAVSAIKCTNPLTTRRGLLAVGLAIACACVGVMELPGAWIVPIALPLGVIVPVMGLIMAVCVLGACKSATTISGFALTVLASGVPLALAPFLFEQAHESLALDAALLVAALAGGLRLFAPHTLAAPFVRLPIALVMGYGMAQAVHYGAWPLAATSLLLWVGGSLMMGKRSHG